MYLLTPDINLINHVSRHDSNILNTRSHRVSDSEHHLLTAEVRAQVSTAKYETAGHQGGVDGLRPSGAIANMYHLLDVTLVGLITLYNNNLDLYFFKKSHLQWFLLNRRPISSYTLRCLQCPMSF